MTDPKNLVERLNEDAEWNWISEDNAGFSAELISNLQHTATLEREAATALASLADELRLAREDACRYRWLRERANTWTVRQFIGNHWRTLMTDQLDAAIDAAASGPKEVE